MKTWAAPSKSSSVPRAARLCVLVGLAVACSSPPSDVALRPGEIARVGDAAVSKPLVQWVLSRDEHAWPALEHDLLLAHDLSRTSPDRARAITRGAEARALLESIAREAEKLGPPTADEWARERQGAWIEIDRPRAVRALDALIAVEPLAPDTAAFELATRLADAVRDARTPDDFARLGGAVVPDPSLVNLRMLPPLAADGRVVPLEARDAAPPPLDGELAPAVNRLEHVGEVSGVVALADGFHVLLAVEIHDAVRLDEAEIERRLAPRIFARRAAPELRRLEGQLRAQRQVVVAPHSEALTRLVWREP